MTELKLALRKPLDALVRDDEGVLFDRGARPGRTDHGDREIFATVAGLIEAVRSDGDDAIRKQALRYDGVVLGSIEVPLNECRGALGSLGRDTRSAMEIAAANISKYHGAQLPGPLEIETTPGVRLGRRSEPLRRVGVYAPGGRAAYPSSVLMCVLPARAAGVEEVVVCSPPTADGLPHRAVLAACALTGADRVFAAGGAGAVAALAFGTNSIPAVDAIVGPGNAFVAEAKRQLTDRVAIDCPAGPSEILVIADDAADPELIAAELIAQAEHDPAAAAVLVTTSTSVADRTVAELRRQLAGQPRREIVESALARAGAVLTVDSLDSALAFAGRYAPEHLLLLVREPRLALERVRCAGTVFLGAPSSVAFGDYITGANHTLPTGRMARAYGGLSTGDFLRSHTWQELTPAAAAELSEPTAAFAEAEGLPGHARAARLRAARLRAEGSEPSDRPGPSAGSTAPEPAAARRAPPTDTTSDTPAPGRTSYRDIELYDPDRRPCPVDLSDNTSRFGSSPAARRVLAELGDEDISRYPSVYATSLKQTVADRLGISPDNVATGCGTDDLIDSLLRAFCEPGDAITYPEPTFGMIPIFGHMNGLRLSPAVMREDFGLDLEAMLAARATVTYVCRPNNPTGTVPGRGSVERLEAESGGVVLLDEAYVEFAGDSMARWAAGSRRGVVLRTMSKVYGLAGLRVGYAVGPAPLIREVEKSRGPYKVNGPAERAAVAALTEDDAWVADVVERVAENRRRLREELEALGLCSWPSGGNFVLVRAPANASRFAERLRKRGVQVRFFPALPVAGDCVRITVAPWKQLEAFLAAVREEIAAEAPA